MTTRDGPRKPQAGRRRHLGPLIRRRYGEDFTRPEIDARPAGVEPRPPAKPKPTQHSAPPAHSFGNPVPGKVAPEGAAQDPPNFRVTQGFADEATEYGVHDGLDLGNGQAHADLFAMDSGEVYQSFYDSGSGGAGIIRIDHGGGWTTGYAHLDELAVKVGAQVKRGQRIGRMDNTGWSSGAHLHYDVTYKGARVDPWPYLNEGEADEMERVPEEKWVNPVHNRRWSAGPNGAKLRDYQGPGGKVLRTIEPGKPFEPTAKVIGGEVGGSTRWFLGWKEVSGDYCLVAVSVTELVEEREIEETNPDVDQAEHEAADAVRDAAISAANEAAGRYP